MKIRMVAMAAGPGGVWPAGSVQDLDEARATALIEGGFAVGVEPGRQETEPAQEDDERPEQPADEEEVEEQPPKRTTRRRSRK